MAEVICLCSGPCPLYHKDIPSELFDLIDKKGYKIVVDGCEYNLPEQDWNLVKHYEEGYGLYQPS